MAVVGLAEILPGMGGYQQTNPTARMVPFLACWLPVASMKMPTNTYDL